jgi:hypothetical protein
MALEFNQDLGWGIPETSPTVSLTVGPSGAQRTHEDPKFLGFPAVCRGSRRPKEQRGAGNRGGGQKEAASMGRWERQMPEEATDTREGTVTYTCRAALWGLGMAGQALCRWPCFPSSQQHW